YLADAALAAAACLGLPFSSAGHANDLYAHPGRLRLKMAAAAFVATCTGFNERYLKNLCAARGGEWAERLDASRVVRVYHGVDLERFSPAPPERAAPRPGRLVSVTRLKEKKGFPYLLEALARLKARGLDVTLEIYGDGDRREAIEARVAQLGLQDRVRLMGAVPHDRIPGVLAGTGLFVLPSVVLPDQDRDGIPNSILEALASGVPVVSTSISGIPEAVRHEQTGLLVPERDAAALAEAIERLMSDGRLRARCARQGRRLVEASFSVEASGRALAELLRLRGAAAGPRADRRPAARA
ncbi:MAG: glycosyltransferase family 4 protein, partial [Planctomycetota bacterium]